MITRSFDLNIPSGVTENGHIVLDWDSDRLAVVIFVHKDGSKYADYVLQNNNPDYGWVDCEDDTTHLVNLFDLPALTLDGDSIKATHLNANWATRGVRV